MSERPSAAELIGALDLAAARCCISGIAICFSQRSTESLAASTRLACTESSATSVVSCVIRDLISVALRSKGSTYTCCP